MTYVLIVWSRTVNRVRTSKLRAVASTHVGVHICLASSTVEKMSPIAKLVFIALKRAFVDESHRLVGRSCSSTQCDYVLADCGEEGKARVAQRAHARAPLNKVRQSHPR